ncbi:MAG: uncharacterized protein QOG72_2265 [Sphingomonadales bacterium]|jgi:hypothetical protein|nr:uncharacterized protein [Sphingomonadales bacterium]
MERVTAFLGDEMIARGERDAVTRELERLYPADHGEIRVFEDGSGRVVDLDYWDRLASTARPAEARARGRPRLGVTAREVTLLPAHWDWLAGQRGGASAALRRLVDEARRKGAGPGKKRDSAYRFMQQMCGDRPGYEEALRSLYRGEEESFRERIAAWPEAIRNYVEELLAQANPSYRT